MNLTALKELAERADLWQWEKQYFVRWTKPLSDQTAAYLAAFSPSRAAALILALEEARKVIEPFAKKCEDIRKFHPGPAERTGAIIQEYVDVDSFRAARDWLAKQETI